MPIDPNRYPPDWDDRSRRIKERDNYTCQLCGATREDGVVLTCAHLDHDETNWEVADDRLATLCAACHLRYDAKDNAKRRSYGKHSRDCQMALEMEWEIAADRLAVLRRELQEELPAEPDPVEPHKNQLELFQKSAL